MKRIFTLIMLSCLAFSVQSQTIKFKKGKVLLDGAHIMNYDKQIMGIYKIHLFSLKSNDEIMEIVQNDNETSGYYDDDFIQIKFLKTGDLVELKSDKTFRKLITWLIQKKVMNTQGEIIESNLDLFIKNYDENITDRTVR